MPETANGSLEGFISDSYELDDTSTSSLETAELLFDVSEELIGAAGPKHEKFQFPLYGKTPFYQNECSDVLTINRYTTGELMASSHYAGDLSESTLDDISEQSELGETKMTLELSIDRRTTRKRNKLPIPLAFGRLALGLSKYQDKVLRATEGDGQVFYSTPLKTENNLLISNLDIYGVSPECGSDVNEIIVMARKIEEVARVIGAHDLLMDSIDKRKDQLASV